MDQLYDPHHGAFSTPSAELQSPADSCRIPGATDIKRLMKLKAEQEQRLKSATARLKLLQSQEDQAWKDVKTFRRRGNQADAAEWQRQVRKEDQRQLQRGLQEHLEALRERAQHVRAMTADTQAPRRQKFEENKQMAQQVREDSQRLMSALRDVREQSRQSKCVQVELRRQQKKQQQLRKNLEATRREQLRQDMNALRFAQLQEEVEQVQQAAAEKEQEEAVALARLQNSQSVRSVREEMAGHLSPATSHGRGASRAASEILASDATVIQAVSSGRGPSRASSEILSVESTVIQAQPPAAPSPEAGSGRDEVGPPSAPGSGALRGSGSLRGSGHRRINSATSAPTPTQSEPASGARVIHAGLSSGDLGQKPAAAPKPQVRAKQPKGYNFSPRSRKSTAGAKRPDTKDAEEAPQSAA